ncbi:FLAVIN-CONTAINING MONOOXYGENASE 1-RELATED [Salix purpurea]|uniref:Flavin-containing monooxygenase n=1 Tax=Salix purpurea TaxID=77065 RepID=A0A9Q0V9Q7_SALPP|nr:FLAVIN-CONTAINING MONOOXYGENASE 1-RELATED [Salix purpurea]
MEKQVAIIGAARNSIGGVWINTVETTKLQTPKPAFQFSDFPWPDSVPELFPNQFQVLDYLQSYAHHFDLIKHIKFGTKVLGIKYQGASDEEMQSWCLWEVEMGEPFSSRGKWVVEAQDTQNLSTEVYQVDFVILCIGRFSDVPNIPEFPPDKGPEAFHGDVIHSMDYANMDYESARDFVRGRRVTVVGFQKSAMDIAMECSTANGVEHPCRVLYLTEHWNVPDYNPWGVLLPYLYLNRFSELMVHKPGKGFLLSLLATILAPLRLAFSKFFESNIEKKLLPHGFYDKAEEGSIILKKAPSFSFCKGDIKVQGEDTPLETDLVILATGFQGEKNIKDIFESKTFQDHILGSPDAAVPLYRECIHPRIPQLAVIGFSESVANLYTSEMRCRWTAELLDSTFKLPSIKEMESDAAKWDQYLKRFLVGITADLASVPSIYGIMIRRAKTWDGTQRERRDSLLNRLSST